MTYKKLYYLEGLKKIVCLSALLMVIAASNFVEATSRYYQVMVSTEQSDNFQAFMSKVRTLNLNDRSLELALENAMMAALVGDADSYEAEAQRAKNLYEGLDLLTRQKLDGFLTDLPMPSPAPLGPAAVASGCSASCLFTSCTVTNCNGTAICSCFLGFAICGCYQPSTALPSLSTYGLIALALLLAGTAVWMFRRRRVSVA